MNEILKAACYTILGAGISAGALIWSGYIQQKHEDDRLFKELAYKAALEEWHFINKKNDSKESLPPLDELILSHLFVANIVKTYNMNDMTDEKRKVYLKNFLIRKIEREKLSE